MMKQYALGLLMLFVLHATLAGTATVYKWVDSNGNVTFSDKPHVGAEEVQIPNVQTYSAPPDSTFTKTMNELLDEPKKPEQPSYKITITEPEDQFTIRNPQGAVNVVLDVTPKLRDSDKIQILLDNTPITASDEGIEFALQNIKRGAHTLIAQVLDKNDRILKSSEPVTIYMMPPRVGMGTN